MVVGVHKLMPPIDVQLPLNVSNVCKLIMSGVLLKAMYSFIAFYSLLKEWVNLHLPHPLYHLMYSCIIKLN